MNPDPIRPPDTDDEPWAVPDDALAPARGCLFALALAIMGWAAVGLIVWRIVR